MSSLGKNKYTSLELSLSNLLFESDRDLPHNSKICVFANY